jgi:hypothetical protein
MPEKIYIIEAQQRTKAMTTYTTAFVEGLWGQRDELRVEVERLTLGFMRYVQDDNDCPVTGTRCQDKCACELEMKEWIHKP